MPAKVGVHLKLAHQKFSKLDFSGAETEVDRALQVDLHVGRSVLYAGIPATPQCEI